MKRPGRWLVCLLMIALPAAALGMDVRADSETILRWYEREDAAGKEHEVLPVYEYLRIELGQLDGKGLSFHGYGWGRYDFGDDYFEDDAESEILYGYLQYTHDAHNLSAWAGRQFIFEGVSNLTVDGVGGKTDLGQWFGASLYFGQPVDLSGTDGRDGDFTWGGRLSHHLGHFYEVGLSYKRVDNDSDKQVEVMGFDSSLGLGSFANLNGFSAYNLEEDDWQEHSYEVSARLGKFTVRPFYQFFDYAAYFDTGVDTGSPFVFLKDSDEEVTKVGVDLGWTPTAKLELGLKGTHYNYDVRDDDARYFAALGILHFDNPLNQVGGEVGVMDGDTSDTQYSLWRGYYYWDLRRFFLSGDVVYVDYDEEIEGEDEAIFLSLGGGYRLLDDALELRVSGDYSSDPYFDDDWRALAAVRYLYDR